MTEVCSSVKKLKFKQQIKTPENTEANQKPKYFDFYLKVQIELIWCASIINQKNNSLIEVSMDHQKQWGFEIESNCSRK